MHKPREHFACSFFLFFASLFQIILCWTLPSVTLHPQHMSKSSQHKSSELHAYSLLTPPSLSPSTLFFFFYSLLLTFPFLLRLSLLLFCILCFSPSLPIFYFSLVRVLELACQRISSEGSSGRRRMRGPILFPGEGGEPGNINRL